MVCDYSLVINSLVINSLVVNQLVVNQLVVNKRLHQIAPRLVKLRLAAN